MNTRQAKQSKSPIGGYRQCTAFLAVWVLFGFPMSASDQMTPLDRYIQEAQREAAHVAPSGGSLYAPHGPLAELVGDARARQVDDMVTIVVSETASASNSGTTSSSRKTSASAGVPAIYGHVSNQLSNLASASSASSLAGTGTTSRQSAISTRLSARVTHVLPNGYLVVEGSKEITVNSDRQLITVRGIVRPIDLARDNSVTSDRVADIQILVDGKGVVNDAIRRPNFLYRLLLGLLPF
ncbi:MAG TPA: flagellar basal body L-ring protein FlgH [Bryobacterales bacterium]|nr:flagellar basal body L-ring protein FlgH [Bryobacterales bacterium]